MSIEWNRISSSDRPVRIIGVAMLVVAIASIGLAAPPQDPEDDSGPEGELVLALPIPAGAQVLERSIDRAGGRSLLVVDMAPADPPSVEDTAVFMRLDPIPGVLLARVAGTIDLQLRHGDVDWWVLPHHGEFRISSHASMAEAGEEFRASRRSGNP